jgi:hypothetical protein
MFERKFERTDKRIIPTIPEIDNESQFSFESAARKPNASPRNMIIIVVMQISTVLTNFRSPRLFQLAKGIAKLNRRGKIQGPFNTSIAHNPVKLKIALSKIVFTTVSFILIVLKI